MRGSRRWVSTASGRACTATLIAGQGALLAGRGGSADKESEAAPTSAGAADASRKGIDPDVDDAQAPCVERLAALS